ITGDARPSRPWLSRSSSKVGVADRGTSDAAPLFVVSRPYEHWSWRLWGLWATRRVVQGPVGKLALELVHGPGSLHSPSEGARRPGTAHALHRMEPASRKRKRRRSAAPAFGGPFFVIHFPLFG